MSSFIVTNATSGDVFLTGNYKIPHGETLTIEVIKLLLDEHLQEVMDALLLSGSITVLYRDTSITSVSDILSYEDEVSPITDLTFWVDPTNGGNTQAGTFENPVQTVDRALELLADEVSVITGNVIIYIKQGTSAVREDIDLDDYNIVTEGAGTLTFEGYLDTAVVDSAVTAVPTTRQITDAGTSPFVAGHTRALVYFDDSGDNVYQQWRWIHTVDAADTVTFNRTTTTDAVLATDAFQVFQPVVWSGATAAAPTVAARDNCLVNKKGVNVVFKKIRMEYAKLQAYYQVGGSAWFENFAITNSGATGPVQGLYLNDVVSGGYNFWITECTTGFYALGGRHFWLGDFADAQTTPNSVYEWSVTDCVTTGLSFINTEVVGAGGLYVNDDCTSYGLYAVGTKAISCGVYTEITALDGDGMYMIACEASFVGSTVNANAAIGAGANIYAEMCDLSFTSTVSDIGDSAGDYNLEMVGGHLQITNASLFDAATTTANMYLQDVKAWIMGAADVGDGGGSNLVAVNSEIKVGAAALFDGATGYGAQLINSSMYITHAADFGDGAGAYNYSQIGGSLIVAGAALFDVNTVGGGMYLDGVKAVISGDADISGNATNNIVTLVSDLSFEGTVKCNEPVAGNALFVKGGNVSITGVCDFGDSGADNVKAYGATVTIESASRFDASIAGSGFIGANCEVLISDAAIFDGNQTDNFQLQGGTLTIFAAASFDSSTAGSGISVLNVDVYINDTISVDGNQLSNFLAYGGTAIITAAATFSTSTAGSGIEMTSGNLHIDAAAVASLNGVDGLTLNSCVIYIGGSSVQDDNTGDGINIISCHGNVDLVVQGVANGDYGIDISGVSMIRDGGGSTFLGTTGAQLVNADSSFA